jgi:hypothetical protein
MRFFEQGLRILEKFIEVAILKVQQEYYDKDGTFKYLAVSAMVKNRFGWLITKLDITNEQLEFIIKRVYEYLRHTNFGKRFETPVK